MYSNIGSKIKKLAVITATIGIIASVIAGILTIAAVGNFGGSAGGGVIGGLLIIILGSLAAWIGSFMLYGFGTLVQDTADIKAQLKANNH